MELFGLDLTSFLVVLVVLLTTYLVYSSWTFSHFKDLGYPGPTPLPVFGTMFPLFKKGFLIADTERIRRYGNFVATFEGRFPVLLVADLDTLKQIMVKESHNFANRRMMSRINRCAMDLVDNLKEAANENQPFEFKKVCGDYTMDVIASTAFGLQVNSQKDKDNLFVKHARTIFEIRLSSPVLLIAFFAPFLAPILSWMKISSIAKETKDFFVDIVNRTIQQRKESDSKQSDFIQLMIEAERNDAQGSELERNNGAGKEIHKALTREEILAQALIFFIAGYETTATTISFIGYNLALNPEIQDKLIDEVDDVCGKDGEVTTEHANKMHYMEMVVQESMRLYPPATRTDRVAGKTVTIDGITIPKDTVIGVPIWHLHYDPNIWPDPEKFDPNRFTQEAKAARHPFAYMPFGMGPRNCIGMRLAQLEVKVALAYLLRKYRFTTCEQTQIPLRFKPSGLLMTEKGITLKIQHRN